MMGGPGRQLRQDTQKAKDISATLKRLVKYFSPYWLILLFVSIFIVGATWTQVRTPDLIGQAVDCFITPATVSKFADAPSGAAGAAIPGQPVKQTASQTNCWYTTTDAKWTSQDYINGLGGLILLVVGLFVAGAIMTGLQFYTMTWTGQHVLRNLRVEVFDHLHKLSLNFYAENEAGNVMSRITNDIETIQQAISFALVSVTSGTLLLVWIGYTMLSKSVAYALISMAVVPFMIIATNWFSSRARDAFRITRQEIGKVNANLQESISGVREVQAFNREEANIEEFERTNAANRDANIKAVSYTAALSPVLESLGYLAVAIVTITGGIFLLRGQDMFGTTITLGLIITFLSYTQRFNQPIQQISSLWANIQNAIAGAERIFNLLDTEPDIFNAPDAISMNQIQGKVEFDHVSAQYVPGELVLNDVSFTAAPGQTVAIVGPTGAGKTTIINLLPRFYDVVSGQVRIDDVDVRKMTTSSLRKQIGIVLQDTFLFSDTVMNNIRFGRPEASDEDVKRAAQLARADDFIQRLPNKYETILGEHGAGLSQGQRQLVAIARAALADPRILILDEATSSVDTRTERQIQSALEVLLKGRTSFVIAHRLSTIRNADMVMVIEGGKIVECGKHDELLANKGAYYNMYMRQFVNPSGPNEPNSSNIPALGGLNSATSAD